MKQQRNTETLLKTNLQTESQKKRGVVSPCHERPCARCSHETLRPSGTPLPLQLDLYNTDNIHVVYCSVFQI